MDVKNENEDATGGATEFVPVDADPLKKSNPLAAGAAVIGTEVGATCIPLQNIA